MTRRSCFLTNALALCAAVLLCIPSANAKTEAYNIEITPFAGYRTGGSFSEKDGPGRVNLNDSSAAGIILNFRANAKGQYELLYASQRTDAATSGFFENDPKVDLDIETLQFGGTYLFDGDVTRPFIALTLGATRFDSNLPDSSSESFLSASLGGGLQIMPAKRLGIRLEARMYTTFVDDESSIFCSSIDGAGSCNILIAARTMTQWEAHAGLVFRF